MQKLHSFQDTMIDKLEKMKTQKVINSSSSLTSLSASSSSLNKLKVFLMILFFMAVPILERMFIYQRHEELSSPIGFVFGAFQDFAIAIQSICFLLSYEYFTELWFENRYIHIFIALLAFIWTSLLNVLDWAMLVSFLPRLNLSFVLMAIQNISQFQSSFQGSHVSLLSTLSAIFLYLSFGLLFAILFCPFPIGNGFSPLLQHRKKLRLSIAFLLAFSSFSYAVFLTRFLSPHAFTSEVMNNIMFAVQSEYLGIKLVNLDGDALLPPVDLPSSVSYQKKLIGNNEIYETDEYMKEYPFTRKTLGFKGTKLFDFKKNGKTPPNIVFVNLESWRSREVGVLGNKREVKQYKKSITPNFDALSKDGVLFESHYSPAIQTSRSLLSSLFGILPHMSYSSAVGEMGTQLQIRGLPHFLKHLGYHNEFFSGASLSWDNWDTFLPFNKFDLVVGIKTIYNILSKILPNELVEICGWGIHDRQSFDALRARMGALSRTKTPYFIDFYTITTHDPFTLPDSYQTPDLSELTNTKNKNYLETIHYSDEMLGNFVEHLRRDGLMNNTILFIQGDHGAGMNKHQTNYYGVSSKVWDEVTRVPFLILADELLRPEDKGKTISEVSSQVSLMATVIDIIGVPKEGFWQHGMGDSLLRSNPNRKAILLNPFEGATIGLRTSRYKYVFRDTVVVVYDMQEDPEEEYPVVTTEDYHNMALDLRNAYRLTVQGIQLTTHSYQKRSFYPKEALAEKNIKVTRKLLRSEK